MEKNGGNERNVEFSSGLCAGDGETCTLYIAYTTTTHPRHGRNDMRLKIDKKNE